MVLATPEEQFRAGYLLFVPERYEHTFVTANRNRNLNRCGIDSDNEHQSSPSGS
jgi:hypothetical protein